MSGSSSRSFGRAKNRFCSRGRSCAEGKSRRGGTGRGLLFLLPEVMRIDGNHVCRP